MKTKEGKNKFSFFKMLSFVMMVSVCLTVGLFTLSGCKKEESHTHSFGTEWKDDDTNHWHECSGCEDKKDTAEHTYDDACDTTCNVCEHVRVAPHTYETEWEDDDTNHWHECSGCEDKKDTAEHVYDDECDTTCNVCEHVRVAPHTYETEWEDDDTNHWYECSGCEDKKDTAEHVYDDACDTTCNVCEHVRTITHNFGTEWVTEDETNHYHVCSVCGAHDEDVAHVFVDDHYSVSGTKAYLNKVCSCGKTKVEELKAETFVIVTPSTVQAELDKNINGKTIIFSVGNYEEVIYIRPSYDTATTYSFVSTTERGTIVISNDDVKNGDVKTQYHYFRTLQNVKFVGVEGAIISNEIVFYTRQLGYKGYASSDFPVNPYDSVKGVDFTGNNCSSFCHLTMNNITFEYLNFSTDNGNISIFYDTYWNSIENFTVKNCNFKNTTDTKTKCALQISARLVEGTIKNVNFINNVVDGYFKAIEVVAFENATITGNIIQNCKHNGVSLFGSSLSGVDQRVKGTLIIENNTFTNGTNQPIKILYGQDCVVSIKNNVINNYQHASDYLIEVANINDTKEGVYSTLTFVNNTYNGHTYMDILDGKINELGNTDEDEYIALYIRPSQFVN